MSTFDRIKELAKSHGMSLKDLSLKLGMGENSIYRWTNTTPSLDNLQKVADYFDVSIDYLLARDEQKLNDPVSFYRIDTAGMSPDDIDEIKQQLDDYTNFLKQKLRKQEKGGEE